MREEEKKKIQSIKDEDRIKALEKLRVLIDQAITSFDDHQKFLESEGDYDEDLFELKNQFCTFREYWIHKL